LFSVLSVPARFAPYSYAKQSHPASAAPSYFALKRNIFNLFFVKVGWFWITIAYLAFWLLHRSMGPTGRNFSLTPRRVKGLVRWTLVTMWWVFMTQWFVGAGIIDRVFGATGGKCVRKINEADREGMDATLSTLATAAACRLAGGTWFGGHDISGHVFLLVLGSAFLGFEMFPMMLKWQGIKEKRIIKVADGMYKNAATEHQKSIVGTSRYQEIEGTRALEFVAGVFGLSLWMLLMTAAYFHTWFEKVSFGHVLRCFTTDTSR